MKKSCLGCCFCSKEEGSVSKSVMLSLTQHLQRLPLSLLNNLRGRSRIKYGMTSLFNNGGFTLIELLVVVLIIGILAAIAVPQYKKAVNKSRLSTLIPLVSAIKEAEEVYFLTNGYYTGAFEDLDIVPGDAVFYSEDDPGWMRVGTGTPIKLIDLFSNSPRYITETDSEAAVILAGLREDDDHSAFVVYKQFLNNSAYPNKRFCAKDEALCKSLGGVPTTINGQEVWELP